ncbi:hypothetical protein GBA52_027621 [Prunus armeniaca]|nr:hypothetical protein GBA52_027621 [Prunus armeniaca]
MITFLPHLTRSDLLKIWRSKLTYSTPQMPAKQRWRKDGFAAPPSHLRRPSHLELPYLNGTLSIGRILGYFLIGLKNTTVIEEDDDTDGAVRSPKLMLVGKLID